MGTLGRHYHVASISPQGVIYYESEFESAEHSVDSFLGLMENLYFTHIDENHPVTNRAALIDTAYQVEIASAVIGLPESQFRLCWSSCDGQCGTLAVRN